MENAAPRGSRRFWILLVAVVVASLGDAGCLAFAPAVEEPLRVAAVDDLSIAELGLVVGRSTLAEARAAMEQRGLTGITEDVVAAEELARGSAAAGVNAGGIAAGGSDAEGIAAEKGAEARSRATRAVSLSAITADYQSRVLVFRGDRLSEIVELPLHGLPPYGMALRVGHADGADMLLLLYRDPASRAELPPTLLAFRSVASPGVSPASAVSAPSEGAPPTTTSPLGAASPRFVLAASTSLGALATRHDGMTSPELLGGSFEDGVLLVARDRAGTLWDTSYLVRVTPRGLVLTAEAMTSALTCACVRRYALGETSASAHAAGVSSRGSDLAPPSRGAAPSRAVGPSRESAARGDVVDE